MPEINKTKKLWMMLLFLGVITLISIISVIALNNSYNYETPEMSTPIPKETTDNSDIILDEFFDTFPKIMILVTVIIGSMLILLLVLGRF